MKAVTVLEKGALKRLPTRLRQIEAEQHLRGGRALTYGLSSLHIREEFLFFHPVAAFLPDVAELLQGGADLLPGRDAHPPQIVAVDGEARDGPPAELRQQLLLALVLQ